MPDTKREQLGCFLALPFSPEFEAIRRVVNAAVTRAGFRAISFENQPPTGRSIRETLMGELAQADCVIADLTNRNPNVHFELGLAQAMGKAVFPIVRRDSFDQIPFDLRDVLTINYEPTPIGLRNLRSQISKVLSEFRRSPRKSQFTSSGRVSTPFFIDWDKLDPTEVENLCRELLSQMGLRRLDWYKESKEIDLIAEYPRKDPDGFEYRELWLVSMGRNAPIEMLLEMAGDGDYFLHHLLRQRPIEQSVVP